MRGRAGQLRDLRDAAIVDRTAEAGVAGRHHLRERRSWRQMQSALGVADGLELPPRLA
jgi:hypothetical protein